MQIEPSMGYQRGLPLLLIEEKGVNNVGVWNPAVTPFLIIEWDFTKPLDAFLNRVERREILQNWIV
ncbi:hypothetical protein [Priestia megaterium]|uniref:hypothetical protein n=1 Tax=Priestia megaterium TaxID=1404 RepID=UPI00101D6D40|nr:hypothetical protein [Priestia megaterium]